MTFPFPTFAAGTSLPVSSFWVDTYSDATDTDVYTFSSIPLGAADASRYIMVGVVSQAAATISLTSVTIAGVSATKLEYLGTTAGVSLWFANVPSGTSGSVVVTFTANQQRCRIGVWAYTAADQLVPLNTKVQNGTASSFTLSDVPIVNGGFLLTTTGVFSDQTSTSSWSGADTILDRYNGVIESDSVNKSLFADIEDCTELIDSADFSITFSASAVYFTIASGFAEITGSAYTPVLADSGSDATNLTTYTFTGRNIGTANAARQLIICIGWSAAAARTVSSVTVGGVSATLIDASANSAMLRLPYATGTTANLVITMSAGLTCIAFGIYDTRTRAMIYPVDNVWSNATGTTGTAADVAVRDGGFLIGVSRQNDTDTPSASYNGIDSLTIDASIAIESTTVSFLSCLTTETIGTNDPGVSNVTSSTKRMVFASFV